MTRIPGQAILLPPSATPPEIINVSGTLNAGNSYQYTGTHGAAGTTGQTLIVEILSFSMTNYLQIEMETATVGDWFAYSTTYYNEFGLTLSSYANFQDWAPLTLAYSGKMVAYDGVTDYAGTSGFELKTTYAFDPSLGNGSIAQVIDNPFAFELNLSAFMDHAVREPSTGTLHRNHYTTFQGQIRYYYF